MSSMHVFLSHPLVIPYKNSIGNPGPLFMPLMDGGKQTENRANTLMVGELRKWVGHGEQSVLWDRMVPVESSTCPSRLFHPPFHYSTSGPGGGTN